MGVELGVGLGEQRNAVCEAKLGAGGRERGVPYGRGAVDHEARAGQRLQRRHQRRIAHPIMRAGKPSAQRE